MSVTFYLTTGESLVGGRDGDGIPKLYLDLCNVNARILLALLGWRETDEGLVGSVSIPVARRALMRARARFDRMAPGLARPSEIVYGTPRIREDGTIEIRSPKYIESGFTEEDILDRLNRFSALVERGSMLGATEVMWS